MKRPLVLAGAVVLAGMLACSETTTPTSLDDPPPGDSIPTPADTVPTPPDTVPAPTDSIPPQAPYVAVDLGVAGSARFINDAGQIVGTFELPTGESRVFFWEDGVATDIGTLGGANARLVPFQPSRSLGNGGHVIGNSEVSGGEWRTFLWHEGTMTDLGAVSVTSTGWVNGSGQVIRDGEVWEAGAWTPIPFDFAPAINDAGLIAGTIWGTAMGVDDRLGIWDGTTLLDAGNLHPGLLVVYGINEAGQVIGRASTSHPSSSSASGQQRAFLWDGDEMIDLGTFGGTDGRASQAADLNEHGQVVGSASRSDGTGAPFLWSGGVLTELPLLDGSSGGARAINDSGVIVGTSSSRAVVWLDGSPSYLETLGGSEATANDLNEDGWIVGHSTDADGTRRATLWRPRP